MKYAILYLRSGQINNTHKTPATSPNPSHHQAKQNTLCKNSTSICMKLQSETGETDQSIPRFGNPLHQLLHPTSNKSSLRLWRINHNSQNSKLNRSPKHQQVQEKIYLFSNNFTIIMRDPWTGHHLRFFGSFDDWYPHSRTFVIWAKYPFCFLSGVVQIDYRRCNKVFAAVEIQIVCLHRKAWSSVSWKWQRQKPPKQGGRNKKPNKA